MNKAFTVLLLVLAMLLTVVAPAAAHEDQPVQIQQQRAGDELVQLDKAGSSGHLCWHSTHTKWGVTYRWWYQYNLFGQHFHVWKTYNYYTGSRIGTKTASC